MAKVVEADARNLLGHLREAKNDKLLLMQSLANQYGDAVSFRLAGHRLYFLNNPTLARDVLVTNADSYSKGIGLRQARAVLGDGLLTAEGSAWTRQRRVVAPRLRREVITSFESSMANEAADLAQRWISKGPVVNIRDDIAKVALDNLGAVLFNRPIPAAAQLSPMFHHVQRQAMFEVMTLNFVPRWLPTVGRARMHLMHRKMKVMILELLHDEIDPHSFLGQLREMLDQRRITLDQATHELMTLFLAGHDTTASTLGWTLYELAREPKLQERIASLLAAGSTELLTAAVQESLRLHPPVWLLPRQAKTDTTVQGIKIAQGDDVVILPYTLHRHPEHWDSPEAFDPERFLDDRSARSNPAYMPFGLGPRSCVGSQFGLRESIVTLSELLQRVRFIHIGPPPRPEALLTLNQAGGLTVTVAPRGRT